MTSPSVLGLPGGIKKPNRETNLFIITLLILHIGILAEMGDIGLANILTESSFASGGQGYFEEIIQHWVNVIMILPKKWEWLGIGFLACLPPILNS